MNSSTLMQSHSLQGQHYGYTAADMESLGASEYTLVTIVVDKSGSVGSFKTELEECIKAVVEACKFSPRSDYLLIRIVLFNHDLEEVHGFKQLRDCVITDYDGCVHPSGSTLLFETCKNAVDATNAHAKQLDQNDYESNAIVIFMTDGQDNESAANCQGAAVGDSLLQIGNDEICESILSILIGVNVDSSSSTSSYLDRFKNDAKLDQYIAMKDVTSSGFAKLANFISKSVSQQSIALGSGAVSTPLQF